MHIRVAEGFSQDTGLDNQVSGLLHDQQECETGESVQLQQKEVRWMPSLRLQSPAFPSEKRGFNRGKGKAETRFERMPPSPLRTQSSSSESDNAAGTPHAPTDSPMAKYPPSLPPPSASPNSRRSAKGALDEGTKRTAANAKASTNVNVPIYSTPGPSPRLRTTSSGNLMMRSGSPTPPQALSRTIPPRLSLPWLQGPLPGRQHYEGVSSVSPIHFNANGGGPSHQHPPVLGTVYIHGLENTPQPAQRGPYSYNAPQNFGPSPVFGSAHVFPVPNNGSSNATIGSPGVSNDHSPTGSARLHHPSPRTRTHTLTTSTGTSVSTGTGPSTVDSTGPSTPLHVHGRSPALSTRASFDHGHLRGPQHPLSPQELRGTGEGTEGTERKDPGAVDRDASAVQTHHPQYNAGGPGGGYHGAATPERNGVDITRIEAGLDTRTTVMLKVQ